MPRLAEPVSEKDHASGPADAPLVLVEYGDYQCPDCGEAEPILQAVRKGLGDRLRFVFRDFPLTDIHPNALPAAAAAWAAAAQGRFWPMHDLLLQNQSALSTRDLEGYAERLGLDAGEFRQTLRDRSTVEGIMSAAGASGVHETPTLFVNGVLYDGPFETGAIVAALQG